MGSEQRSLVDADGGIRHSTYPRRVSARAVVPSRAGPYRGHVPSATRPDQPHWRIAPWRFLLSSTPWRSVLFVALTAALGLVLAAPVVATWFVAPFWAVLIARFERWHPVVIREPRIADPRAVRRNRPGGIRERLRDQVVWRELGHLVVFAAFAAAGFALLVLTLVALVLAVRASIGGAPRPDDVIGNAVAGLHLAAPVVLAGSMAVLVVALYGFAALALAEVSIARTLLSGRAEVLEQRVEELTYSRQALLDGFDAERRRIERDLHDGAQQQLTVLAMNVGLLVVELDAAVAAAAERDRPDLDALRTTADRITDNVGDAVRALRDSVRGIHPRVLVDHGFRAAVDELAARSPLPVRVDVHLPERLPARTETAAYFVVSEALTNAVRHGAAHAVSVTAGAADGWFRLEVVDDGTGGAVPMPGGGLDGLRERAAVLGGTLVVDSPAGGPTALRFTVPLHAEAVPPRDAAVPLRDAAVPLRERDRTDS
ncbi:sensor histidine kinase [Curtobacterium sp. MCLR17_043]|nr:sensor histidine kinase [Curtobacterium sp. MCLR17_043]